MKSLAWITGAVQAISLGAVTQVTQAIPGEDQLDNVLYRGLMERIESARSIVFRAWIAGASAGLVFVGLSVVPEHCVDGLKHAWIFIGAFGGLTTIAIASLFRVGVVIFRLVALRNDLRLHSFTEAKRKAALEDLQKTKAAIQSAGAPP